MIRSTYWLLPYIVISLSPNIIRGWSVRSRRGAAIQLGGASLKQVVGQFSSSRSSDSTRLAVEPARLTTGSQTRVVAALTSRTVDRRRSTTRAVAESEKQRLRPRLRCQPRSESYIRRATCPWPPASNTFLPSYEARSVTLKRNIRGQRHARDIRLSIYIARPIDLIRLALFEHVSATYL